MFTSCLDEFPWVISPICNQLVLKISALSHFLYILSLKTFPSRMEGFKLGGNCYEALGYMEGLLSIFEKMFCAEQKISKVAFLYEATDSHEYR